MTMHNTTTKNTIRLATQLQELFLPVHTQASGAKLLVLMSINIYIYCMPYTLAHCTFSHAHNIGIP